MKLRKRKVLLFLLAFFLLYALWLSFSILRFKTYKAPALKPSPLEIEGAYHIHTTYSDGRKSLDEIAKLASQADIDFIIITDHGNPNKESYSSQDWKEGVLVLAGSEVSVSRGHLVALDFELPSGNFSPNTEDAFYEIREAGGFSIISHPYSKSGWSWGEFMDYSGIDIISGYYMLRRNIFASLPSLPALLLKPEYALLKMFDNPHRNLRKWDELNNLHPIYGYFSADAHLLYRPALNLLRLHLLLQSPLSEDFDTAQHQVYEALRKGRFYNSIHAAAHAHGFRFWGEEGGKTTPMGSTVILDSSVPLNIEAPFPFAKEIHLVHNGKMILRSTENSISYEAAHPGTYRVEVYLTERSPLDKNIPWIISNPIFLREDEK
ncbi:MAG TPA: hypothetical protein ENI18_11555 [Candidatus Aminicenantes bacterium]|nr:hypothetical protein [Candidatus Aminicenantes bacterium]